VKLGLLTLETAAPEQQCPKSSLLVKLGLHGRERVELPQPHQQQSLLVKLGLLALETVAPEQLCPKYSLLVKLGLLGQERVELPQPHQQSQSLLVKLGLLKTGCATHDQQGLKTQSSLVQFSLQGTGDVTSGQRCSETVSSLVKLGLLAPRSAGPQQNPDSQSLLVKLGLLGREEAARRKKSVSFSQLGSSVRCRTRHQKGRFNASSASSVRSPVCLERVRDAEFEEPSLNVEETAILLRKNIRGAKDDGSLSLNLEEAKKACEKRDGKKNAAVPQWFFSAVGRMCGHDLRFVL